MVAIFCPKKEEGGGGKKKKKKKKTHFETNRDKNPNIKTKNTQPDATH